VNRDVATTTRPLRDALHRRLLAAPFDPACLGAVELRSRLAALLRDEAPLVSDAAAASVLDDVVADVAGLGPLEALLADPAVVEIMVNGPVACSSSATASSSPSPATSTPTRSCASPNGSSRRSGCAWIGRRRCVDARLPDGSRVHAVLPPLAPDGPCLTIRRFVLDVVGLDAFGLDERASAFLRRACARAGTSSSPGATSAGKTTCANALARAIDPWSGW
jgi:pilus assembly protein CpaF